MSLISVVVAVAAGQVLGRRLGGWNAAVVAGLGFILVVGAVMAALPAQEGTPLPLRDDEGNIAFPGFPADVLAEFQVYALAAQAVLWSVMAVTFAPLAAKVAPKVEAPLTDGQTNIHAFVAR